MCISWIIRCSKFIISKWFSRCDYQTYCTKGYEKNSRYFSVCVELRKRYNGVCYWMKCQLLRSGIYSVGDGWMNEWMNGWMSMDHRLNNSDEGKSRWWQKRLSSYDCVHRQSHMGWSGTEVQGSLATGRRMTTKQYIYISYIRLWWFLVIVQLDAQIPFNIFTYSSLHVSSKSCSSSGETDCIIAWCTVNKTLNTLDYLWRSKFGVTIPQLNCGKI